MIISISRYLLSDNYTFTGKRMHDTCHQTYSVKVTEKTRDENTVIKYFHLLYSNIYPFV